MTTSEPIEGPEATFDVTPPALDVPEIDVEGLVESPLFEEPAPVEPEVFEPEGFDEPADIAATLDDLRAQLPISPVDEPVEAVGGTLVVDAPVLEPAWVSEPELFLQAPMPPESIIGVEELTDTDAFRAWVTGGASATMVGDVSDANFWFQQNSQFSCGPSVATQIIGDFTGVVRPDETEIAQRALAFGYNPGAGGMLVTGLEALLDSEGVPSTTMYDQSFEDVERYLREDRAVVMFLDGYDIFPEGLDENFRLQDEPENSDTDVVNHFVRVVGIDRANGVAILSDPAHRLGGGIEVPLADLEEAWNDVTNRVPLLRSRVLLVSDHGDPTPSPVMLDGQVTDQTTTAVTPEVTDQGIRPVVATGPEEAGPETSDREVVLATEDGATLRTEDADTAAAAAETAAPEAVELGVDAPPATTPAPAADRPVVLPRPATLPVSDVWAPGLEPEGEVALPAAAGDDDRLFDPVHGWVLIPVTLAAARIGKAVRERRG